MELEYIFRIIEGVAACGVGVVGFFVKNQLSNIQKGIRQNSDDIHQQTEKINERIDKVEEKTKRDIEKVEKEFHDFKESIPLFYVTRDDFFRVMHGVENKIDKIDEKLNKLF